MNERVNLPVISPVILPVDSDTEGSALTADVVLALALIGYVQEVPGYTGNFKSPPNSFSRPELPNQEPTR